MGGQCAVEDLGGILVGGTVCCRESGRDTGGGQCAVEDLGGIRVGGTVCEKWLKRN